jgi:hypothetical protein
VIFRGWGSLKHISTGAEGRANNTGDGVIWIFNTIPDIDYWDLWIIIMTARI